MGEIISSNKIDIYKCKEIKLPVVLCNPQTVDEAAIADAGYRRCAFNLLLAAALASLPNGERAKKAQ